jgi:hypothetical protein
MTTDNWKPVERGFQQRRKPRRNRRMAMTHVFDRISQGGGRYLYVVGWFDGANIWHPIRDCETAAEAAMFVSYLNGGERPPLVWEP